MLTTAEFIDGSLRRLPESRWGEVLESAIAHNERAYRLPPEAVKGMYEALSAAQRASNASHRGTEPYRFREAV